MKNGNKANFSTKLIFPKLGKSFRYTPKEDIIKYLLVGTGKRIDLMGQGKYIVEIINWKELFFSSFNPAQLCQTLALGAVAVSAGVICWMLVSA